MTRPVMLAAFLAGVGCGGSNLTHGSTASDRQAIDRPREALDAAAPIDATADGSEPIDPINATLEGVARHVFVPIHPAAQPPGDCAHAPSCP